MGHSPLAGRIQRLKALVKILTVELSTLEELLTDPLALQEEATNVMKDRRRAEIDERLERLLRSLEDIYEHLT